MTEREARIAFNMIPSVGAVTLQRLMRGCGGGAAEAYRDFPDRRDWEGKEPQWEKEIARAEKIGVRILTELDDDYPPQLREIASPPLALYVVGDVKALSKAGVAMVGTRRATAYGKETAEKFAAGLAMAGWAVISGLAVGIDAAAHRGALMGGGITIGVLGGAVDMFYPDCNRGLAREIVEKGGCVVSEFPFGRRPDAQTFPQRNRVVSGLARGVLAVECPLRSGTMSTCMRAVEQGRAVMAVPGRIDMDASAGCLHLIREGARMVTSVADVLEELSPIACAKKDSRPAPAVTSGACVRRPPRPTAVPEAKLTLEEVMVYEKVEGTMSVDALVRASGLSAAKTNAMLVALRLKGKLRFLPGNRVARTD